MVLQVKWNFNLSVESGPAVAAAGKIEATAYDKISVTIKSSAEKKETIVNLQPSNIADINLICITSDQYYFDDDHKLTYSVPVAKNESTKTAGEAPVTPTETAGEAPVTPTETAGEAPVTPTETAGEAPVTPTETAGEAPVTPTETAGEAPVTPTETKLENAQMLVGNSLVSLLGGDIKQLNFVNTTGKDAHVEILIIRNASTE
jgi:hypothetical protein